jgi:hypothetical protein
MTLSMSGVDYRPRPRRATLREKMADFGPNLGGFEV